MKKLPPDYLDKLDFMYTVLQKKLDNIDSAYALLGTKASILFGFVAIIIAFYLGFLFQYTLLACYPSLIYWLRVGSLAGYALVIICLCICIYTKNFDDRPHKDLVFGKESQKKYNGKTPIEVDYFILKRQIIAELREGYIQNHHILKCATWWFKISIWLLLGSICLMIISSLIR